MILIGSETIPARGQPKSLLQRLISIIFPSAARPSTDVQASGRTSGDVGGGTQQPLATKVWSDTFNGRPLTFCTITRANRVCCYVPARRIAN
jgi:hypothetical protein